MNMSRTNTEQGETVVGAFMLSNAWHTRVTELLVGILMIAIYLWLLTGFFSLLFNLYQSVMHDWSHGAESMIKQTVILLASLELVRTFKSYLLIGRVKVTFILDVALVVLIGELISLWYREYTTADVFTSVFVISALVLLRIITARFSPDDSQVEHGHEESH